MRVAVTGASGRLGRAVIERAVADGHEIVALDRVAPAADQPTPGQVRHQLLDTTDAGSLRAAVAGCEALIHLAAYTSPDAAPPHAVHNTNVASSYNALLAAVHHGIRRVCLASSVNAIGGVYSVAPRYDYFPLDEEHPSYTEDPYSLSKWVLEEQARSVARRHPELSIAALRFHALWSRDTMAELYRRDPGNGARNLWGYSPVPESARACLAAVAVDRPGARVYYLVAADTASDRPSAELHREFYPEIGLRTPLAGRAGFYNCAKAEKDLGWPVGDESPA